MSKINTIASTADVHRLWEHTQSQFTLKKLGLSAVALVLSVVFFFPYYWLFMVGLSWPPVGLYSLEDVFAVQDVALFNIVRIVHETEFLLFLFNSTVIVAIAVFGNLVLNSLAAYALIHDFAGKRAVQAFLVAMLMVPYYISIIPIFLITNELGLLNTRIGVALPLSVMVIGIFILKASFQSVPESMLEAARLDDASELYIIFGILWPLAKPALATNVILAFIFSWNAYLLPLVLITDGARQPLPLALAQFQADFAIIELVYAFAILVVLPIIVLFILLQKHFIQSIEMSTIKQ